MAPVKNPNNNTGTVPKSTPSASSSSSSMMETSPSGSSCISSDPNSVSTSIRSNGIAGVEGAAGGIGVAGGSGLNGTVVGAVGGVGTLAIAPPATQATTVPQSGGIGAVGGAMANAYVLRKNTEIVAPIRRELKDLNDYFLSVTESSQTSLPNLKRQNHHYHHRHQPPVTPLAGPSNLDGTTCFDFDHFPDNQRSCYPVRPIPRRTAQSRENDTFHHHSHNHSSHSSCGIPINNQVATVGVVNPTTLGISNEEPHQLRHSTNPFVRYRQPGPPSAINNDIIDIDDILLQRYKYIQYCIKLANKSQNKNKDIMVNENNENEIIVNSTSLEDVASSETSERAQSVTSIHSSVEPSTPTYEDLQTRLEASTRNIQNMKEQQQQLKRLQDQAKQHLAEMESLRSQAAPLRRGAAQNGAPDYENIDQVHTDMSSLVGRMKNLTSFIQGQNELSNLLGDDGPEIMAEQQTLQQKLEGLKSHRDEMKNLILELHEVNRIAERRAYEQHLQQQQQKQPKTEQPTEGASTSQQEAQSRVVPIEYSRIVPIELVGAQQKQNQQKKQPQQQKPQENHINGSASIPNGNAHPSEEEEADDPETAALIQQKMSDIQTMKNQLSRLKSMMETVKLIEERSEGTNPRDIGYPDAGARRSVEIPVQSETTSKNTNTQQRAIGAAVPFDKDRTPVQDDFVDDPEDPAITDKIHILNEVTRDLRSQALSLASERDRIRALKEEIIRRKAANAAASCIQQSAAIDEDKNSNRDRVSPSKLSNKDSERDMLKAQYEAKKKEFQDMCQRMQSEESTTTTGDGRAHEEDEEEEDDLNTNDLLNQGQDTPKPDLSYYYPQSQGVSCNSSVHDGVVKPRGKESADSGAADVHGVPSCEVGSMKSGSSRSYSMPPPMRAMSNREASWRKTSQEHYDHFGPPNVPSAAGSSGPVPPPLPASWNPYYFYNAPYSPHFAQPHTVGASVNTDCICQANANTIANGVATPAGSIVMQSDPVLLQQFIQTQQMLINSVCQCNQMLWHQQREIDSLNSTIHMLQERLLSHTNGTDLAANHRSESVPPAGTVQNNLYPSINRAQSEQPHHFPSIHPHHAHHLPTIMSQSSSSANSFHRRNMCNIQQQQQQQLSNHSAAFNFTADHQSSGNMYSSAVNNLCAPMPPMPNFNNVVGASTTGASNNTGAPFFMHHHNNTQHPVHNNNSNLINAAQQQPPQQSAATAAQNSQPTNVSNGASNLAGSALNNQVPPGNRANNYWDNFRSYSRQNLLSSNSCKSNEEQNHNQQHQQLQQQQQQPQHLQQHLQEPPNLPIFTNSLNVGYRTDSNTNNLNPPSYDNKYLHTFRNRINANSAMHSGGALLNAPPITSSTSSTQTTNYSNMMNIGVNQPESQQQQGTNASGWNGIGGIGEVFESNELAHDIRNMNLNFGNNEPNKVPMKPSSLRRPATSINRRLRHTQSEPATFVEQQQGVQQHDAAGDLLSSGLFSGVMQSLDSAMDDTSDEIKRNLLVNALKSEKFTTKFYESLKEDVFRRIETLLRAKDGEQQFLAQLYRDYNIASTRDPLRKLYLNEVRSLSRPTEELNETESNNGENEDEDDDEDDDEEGAQALDNHNILNNNNNDAQNALGLNAKDMKLLADKFIGGTTPSTGAPIDQTVQFPDYELIHYIIARIHEDTQPSSVINDALLVEIAKLTATAIQNYAIVKCRKKEIIEARLHISPKKIYTKLKAKTFPRDRDGFLMWYQRYLETVLFVTLKRDDDEDPRPSRENNNNAHQSNVNTNQNITTGTLSWMDIHNIYMNAHQVRKSNIPLRPTASGSGASGSAAEVENKIENNSSLKQQQQRCSISSPRPSTSTQQHHLVQIPTPTTPSSNNIMNEDLAEADQICSSANSTMHGSVEVHADENFLLCGAAMECQPPPTPDNADGQLISIPSESQPTVNPPLNQNLLNFFLDETENNENPDEENRHLSADTTATIPHPLLADSDNAEEDADGQNQRPESSLHGAFGTDPLAITGGTGKRNSVP